MKLSSLNKVFRGFGKMCSDYTPQILMGLGTAGVITAVGMVVDATIKSTKTVEYEEDVVTEDLRLEAEDNGEDPAEVETVHFDKKEVFKMVWKNYIPATIMLGASLGCFYGASHIHSKRNAALATAYKLTETALLEYKEAVVEEIGEKREHKVADRVSRKRMEKDPVKDETPIAQGKGGNVLCYDKITCRYFRSDKETIRSVVNDLNFRLMDEMYISLNDYYYELGLPMSSQGEDIGWNVDRGKIDPQFTAELASSGEPCLVVGFYVEPRMDYRNLH